MKTKLLINVLVIVSVMLSCSEKQKSSKNYYDQWIEGKRYSIKAVFATVSFFTIQIKY